MNAQKLLELVDRHAAHIRDSLDAGQLAALSRALVELTEAGEEERALKIALRKVQHALMPLPDGPVRAAVLPDGLRLQPGSTAFAPELARALLARFTVDDSAAVVSAARRRLLGAPSRSAAELDPVSAADPLGAGLIRLPDPERGPRYPDFQFDPGGGGPRAVVQEVNRLLLADQDPWGAADWWLDGHSWLSAPPATLLGSVPDTLLTAAALALVEGEF